MRIRHVLAALGAATLLGGLTAPPAHAGTGASTWCNDGTGGREIPVLTTPVTVGVEVVQPPGLPYVKVWLCYSTTPAGQPGPVTGGAVSFEVWPNPVTGTYVGVFCYPDFAAGAAPTCAAPVSATVAPGDLAVSFPPTSTCLVSLGSGCVAYVPGVRVTTGGSSAPLLALDVLGVPLSLDLPTQCVALVVACP